MKKLIYSKKYPESEELKVPPEVLLGAFAEAAERLCDELVYILLPCRMAFKEKYIEYAKEFAEKYEYDIEIYEARGGVELNLSFDHQFTFGEFNNLIGMSDDISISSGIKGREFTVSLTYYTHAIYRDGKKLLPIM